jgi:hypothetical protein
MEWINNTKGIPPFVDAPETKIDVRYRDGQELSNVPGFEYFTGRDTSSSFWELEGMNNDIVAYRLHEDENGWMDNPGFQVARDFDAVEVKFKNGEVDVHHNACRWNWQHFGGPRSITKFRLKQERKPVVIAPSAVDTLREVVAENDTLKARVEDLKAQVMVLEAKLSSVRAAAQ